MSETDRGEELDPSLKLIDDLRNAENHGPTSMARPDIKLRAVNLLIANISKEDREPDSPTLKLMLDLTGTNEGEISNAMLQAANIIEEFRNKDKKVD